MAFAPHLCAAFTLPTLFFDLSLVGTVAMLLFSLVLPLPLNTAVAFIAGSAAGVALARVAQSHPAAPMLSMVDDDLDATTAVQSIDDLAPWSPAPELESAPRAPRARTGRLPLPECVTSLTPSDEPTLAIVNVFVDRLAALPLEEWLDIGRNELADPEGVSRRATAFAILEATIGTHGLGIAAWYARDAVETSVCLASSGVPEWAARDHRAMAAAHGAAEAAALALLASDALASTDLAALLAPFEHVLSRDEGS